MSITTPLPPVMSKAVPASKAATLDVESVRRDFPILHQEVHGKPLVYLDNAASTQKPTAVIEAIRDYYERDHANVHRAVHLLSERATKAYEEARLKVQKFLGAGCIREIIYTRGTTEAVNLVAHGFLRPRLQAGDEVVLTALEHHSNIVPWQVACLEKRASLRVVPINDAGELRLDELDRLLGPKVKLLTLAHVSNALGTVNPIKEIVSLAHSRGIPVFVDGAQAVSHLKVDVRDLDCDFYAFSGHKVYGPTGIGILYGKARHLEVMTPYQTGGDMISHVSFEKTTWNEVPYKFEAGTPHIAGAVGLGAALDYLESIGRDRIAAHEKVLLDRATQRLLAIPGVRVVGLAKERAGAISFVVDDPPLSPLDVGTKLDLDGIAVRTGHHCCQPLMERYGLSGTTRASFGIYNTLAEVDTFADALVKIVHGAKPRAALPTVEAEELSYPEASTGSPTEAAAELADFFDFVEDWTEKYQHLIEMGEKLLPMPAFLRTEANRVHGCQSTVFLDVRKRPGTSDIVEFLADSDADLVRGLLALLQKLFSGQHAGDIAAFDVEGFFRRLGLDQHLTMGRRNGLAEMTKRVRTFAAQLAARKEVR